MREGCFMVSPVTCPFGYHTPQLAATITLSASGLTLSPGLGMLHLATPAYERCLAIEDEPVSEPANAADKWIPLDPDGDIAMREEEDDDDDAGESSKRDAACALQSIYLSNGDTVNAKRVTERWLLF